MLERRLATLSKMSAPEYRDTCLRRREKGILMGRNPPRGSGRDTLRDRRRRSMTGSAGDHLTSAIEAPPLFPRHSPKVFRGRADHHEETQERSGPWMGPRTMLSGGKQHELADRPHQNPAAVPIRGATAAKRPPARTTPSCAAALASSVALDAIPSSPPAEVLEQMAGAAQVYERLSAQGRELRFARDEPAAARRSRCAIAAGMC